MNLQNFASDIIVILENDKNMFILHSFNKKKTIVIKIISVFEIVCISQNMSNRAGGVLQYT